MRSSLRRLEGVFSALAVAALLCVLGAALEGLPPEDGGAQAPAEVAAQPIDHSCASCVSCCARCTTERDMCCCLHPQEKCTCPPDAMGGWNGGKR